MTTPNDGGPAFPGISGQDGMGESYLGHDRSVVNVTKGMSLRAWLAGMVAPAILADISRASAKSGVEFTYAEIAEHSVKYADALLAALQDKPK